MKVILVYISGFLGIITETKRKKYIGRREKKKGSEKLGTRYWKYREKRRGKSRVEGKWEVPGEEASLWGPRVLSISSCVWSKATNAGIFVRTTFFFFFIFFSSFPAVKLNKQIHQNNFPFFFWVKEIKKKKLALSHSHTLRLWTFLFVILGTAIPPIVQLLFAWTWSSACIKDHPGATWHVSHLELPLGMATVCNLGYFSFLIFVAPLPM